MKQILLTVIFLFFFHTVCIADFTNNGNGTTTDNITGLVWTNTTVSNADETVMAWIDAITVCETLEFAEHTDWRLPNVKELRSIVDTNLYGPAIDNTVFNNMIISNSTGFWTSTSLSLRADTAWTVNLFHGAADFSEKNLKLSVIAVRNAN